MDDKTLALFDKPFSIDEHGFVQGVGFYILKSAIHRRLREIDPRYRTTPPELVMIDDDMVVMRGGLTVLGETRFALGTGKIDRTKKDFNTKQEVDLPASEIVRNKLKAIKQAASDLLPRGAQQFGIGDYMRDVPKEARAKEEFPKYLAKIHAAWEKAQQPVHWALNGGGKRVQSLMTLWELPWKIVAARIETDHVIGKMSETTLSEVEFIARLVILKDSILPVPADGESEASSGTPSPDAVPAKVGAVMAVPGQIKPAIAPSASR